MTPLDQTLVDQMKSALSKSAPDVAANIQPTFDPHSDYLGDGVYVNLDEANMVHLYTDNGMAITNEIFLEPEVLRHLESWLERVGWRCS